MPHGQNGCLALTNRGEVFQGFFINKGPYDRPEFGWRKLPSIPKDVLTYQHLKEPTLEDLNAAKNAALAAALKKAEGAKSPKEKTPLEPVP